MTPNPLKNGRIIKTDCTIAEYLRSKGGENGEPKVLSRTDLIELGRCPSKWIRGGAQPDKSTPSTEFGSLFDCLLLQPHKLTEYYVLTPATYITSKKEEKPWTRKSSTCREWEEEKQSAGFLICSREDIAEAETAIQSLYEDPDYGVQTRVMLTAAKKQVFMTAEYQDPETGILVYVKVLTDIVPAEFDPDFGQTRFDLKTARTADPERYTRHAYENGYHVQAALNMDVHNAYKPGSCLDFRNLIVENSAPFQVHGAFFDETFIDLGRATYLKGLQAFCRCVKSKKWPGYSGGLGSMRLKGYDAIKPEAWMIKDNSL